MPPPPRKQSSSTEKVRFQPNPVWLSEDDMNTWLKDNIRGEYEVVKVWKVEMFACEISAEFSEQRRKGKRK